MAFVEGRAINNCNIIDATICRKSLLIKTLVSVPNAEQTQSSLVDQLSEYTRSRYQGNTRNFAKIVLVVILGVYQKIYLPNTNGDRKWQYHAVVSQTIFNISGESNLEIDNIINRYKVSEYASEISKKSKKQVKLLIKNFSRIYTNSNQKCK